MVARSVGTYAAATLPPLRLETAQERQRFDEARQRREQVLVELGVFTVVYLNRPIFCDSESSNPLSCMPSPVGPISLVLVGRRSVLQFPFFHHFECQPCIPASTQ